MRLRKLMTVILASSCACLGQQAEKAALRQQAFALLTQARAAVAKLPAGGRKGILDSISITLFQAGDQAGAAAVLKEALAVDREDVQKLRDRPQRPSAVGTGFAFSGAGNSVMYEARTAEIHAVAGDQFGARAWLQEAVQNMVAVSDERERSTAVRAIAKAQIAVGDFEAARQMLATTPAQHSVNVDGLAEIAEARARGGDVAGAKSMTQGQNEVATATILEKVAEEQAASKDFGSALETASSISVTPAAIMHRVQALLAIALEQHKQGDEKAASATFALAIKVAEKQPSVNQLIAVGEARAGRFPEALQLASSIPDSSYGVKPMLYMEIAVMAGNAKHPEIVMQALALARAAIDANDAIENSAESRAHEIQPGDEPANRKQGLLQTLAVAQAQAGDIEGALRTAREINDRFRSGA
jgi:tetratricopeptide (TPR) repeat protein